MAYETLVHMLERRAAACGSKRAFTWLAEGEREEKSLTYAEIDGRARAIAATLSMKPGERALMLYPPGLDFIEGFFGCLYAGVVAVPAYPPDPTRLARTLPRLQAIAKDAGATTVVTTAPLAQMATFLFAQAPELASLRWVATDEAKGDWQIPSLDGDALAFFQYTSGSTGTPKGVMLSHGNLVHNEAMIQHAFETTEDSIVVGWLPQYHDMGLIGNVLQPLWCGGSCVLMSPLDFLSKPMRWLRALSTYRGTTSGGPNFAYDLCARKSTPDERAALDLSSWSVAFSGAEPVRAETMERFVEAFGPQGFSMARFYPCYGLAESSLLVSGGRPSEPPIVATLSPGALAAGEAVDEASGQRFVGCGRALLDEQIVIVDPTTHAPCSDGRIGEIWVKSGSIARGYFGKAELSAETFGARLATGEGPFLRTGDLGFFRAGELFVSGRRKDLIIIRGRNVYPQDVELTVEESHPALRPGCGAAFSVERDGEERLVIVQEVDRRAKPAQLDDAITTIRESVAEAHGVQVDAVVLLPAGAIAKTTSGKIQRHASKAQYLAHELAPLRAWESGAEQAPVVVAEVASPLVSQLGAIVAEALGLEAIDPKRSLASYGVDSLGAVELQGALRSKLGKEVALGALIEGGSLEKLAELVERSPLVVTSTHAPSHERPLTIGQRALLVADELEPGSAAYHIALSLRLESAVDAYALERALGKVIAHHEVLRATIDDHGGEPRWHVHAEAPRGWWRTEIAGDATEPRIASIARTRFDLRREAPLRAVLLEGAHPVLVLVLHHVASDLWSMALLARQLGEALAAERTGASLSWPSGTLALGRDQAAMLASPAGRAQLDAWVERLSGELPTLELPTDRTRRKGSSGRSATLRFELDEGTTSSLRALAKRHDASLVAVLLAADAVLLARYGGQREVVIGVPTNNRGSADRAGVMGYLVNTLPLRVVVDPAQSFDALVAHVRDRLVELVARQDTPLAAIVERLAARGGGAPFRTTLTFQRLPREFATTFAQIATGHEAALDLGGLRVRAALVDERDAHFATSLVLAEVEGRLFGSLEYATDLFEAVTARDMVEQWRRVTAELVSHPSRSVGHAALLSADEQRQLEALGVAGAARTGELLSEIEARARSLPHEAAVLDETSTLDFATLVQRAAALGHALVGANVARDERVLLLLDRSVDIAVAMLGCWYAGAAFVPVEPSTPAARVDTICADAGIRVVVTTRLLAAPASLTRVLVDELVASTAPGPRRPLPDGLAYVLYTSGSTGTPKGVGVTHGSLANLAAALQERIYAPLEATLGRRPRLSMNASYAFDSSMKQWVMLSRGYAIAIVPERVRYDALALADFAAERAIDALDCAPAQARLLADQRGALPAALLVGGEAIDEALWQRLGVLPRTVAWNVYGPTECTVDSTVARIAGAQPTIGRALDGVRIHVVDGEGQLAVRGARGELCIGGAGVARGYLGRPDLTAERFVPDPFSDQPGARMYRTGDHVRWRGDGQLAFHGRLDHQVKLRGFRIELGEVESALSRLAGVRAATVVLRDAQLVGYVAGDGDPVALKRELASTLPAYMVPSVIVRLDALPLTPNGKVDRKALPAPSSQDHVAPRDDRERVIADIWAALLGVERVGAHDDFFALGGHSLLATQAISQLRARLGVDLPLRALFEASTVAALASRVAEARATSEPGIAQVTRGARPPLSFAQERLWFLDQLEPGSAAYNVPAALRIEGELDVDALVNALSAVVARHETLRTTFAVHDGVPYQVVHGVAPVSIPVDDVGDVDAAVRAAWRAPFDLERGPLLRLRLLRVSARAHVLVVVMHHIVSDGWSTGVLLREVSALYAGKSLPPLQLQYADYATWQRTQGERIEREAAYWKKQLAGAPGMLELPTDRPRPAVQSSAGASVPVLLDADRTTSLQRLAREHDATLFMVLLATWQLLLSRYSGQNDIVVGSPIANRTRVEVEPIMGFFVNSLALRADLSGRPTFVELLRRVRETTLAAYERQQVPFERVVEVVNPIRSMSHPPLFQVMFGLLNASDQALELGGLRLVPLTSKKETAKFDLTLNVSEGNGQVVGDLEYATALFDRETAEQIARHWVHLLDEVARDPLRPVDTLELMTTDERAQIAAWTAAPRRCDAGLVHELFARQAARTPDAIAIGYEGATLTYRALDASANRVAHALVELGVQPGELVGLGADRSLKLIVGMLGILKAGGAYVPLDPEMPLARRQILVEEAQLRVVVGRGAEDIEGCRTLRLDDTLLARYPEHAPSSVGTPDGAAYVMFTSGSTGRPKGVVVAHRGIVRLVLDPNYMPITSSDVYVHHAPGSFDASTLEVWGPLLNGARLELFRAGPLDLEELADFVRARGVTMLWITTGLFHVLVETQLEKLTALKYIIQGGETVSVAHVRKALDALPGTVIINAYGPTENTTFTTCHTITSADDARHILPIGVPISATTTYVLDEQLAPVPIGVLGELYTGGEGLARGYLGQPGLTAEKFVPSPFGGGERLYKTGDRARWLREGTLEFGGRADQQVKVRGFRIELGEIEIAIASQEGVREVAVVARGQAGAKMLVAYVAGEVSLESLRATLKKTLPDFMVPVFVRMEHLPLNVNGKVDRKALPEPVLDSAEYLEPRDERERAIADVWRDVLGVERVGAHDDFFALGGHSLLATQVVSKLRARLHVEVPVRVVFEAPTVAQLAAHLAHASEATTPALGPMPRGERPALSFAQERLWFLDQLEPGSASYHIAAALRLTGELDVAALERALSAVVARHEALRTTFAEQEGEPYQVVYEPRPLSISIERVAELEVEARVREVTRQAFDLARGPLLRVRLLRVAEREHVLVVVMHHIVSDGWSVGVLVREVTALYAGEQLPALTVQYADYALWQRQKDARIEREVAYWKQQLDGAPSLLELPTDRPRPAAQSFTGATVPVRLGVESTRALHAFARAHDATPFMVLLAAWQVVLSRHSGQKDVVVGSPIANRTAAEVEPLIGFFVNTLALRTDLSGDPSFADVVARVRETTLAAYEHQEAPFERVVEAVNPERSMSHAPLFQVMFALQNAPQATLELAGLTIASLELGNDATKFDLTLTLAEIDGALTGTLAYATALFDEQTAQRLASAFVRTVEAPDGELPIAERAELLALGLGDRVDRANELVHEVVAAQAAKTPAAIALELGDEHVRYDELEARVVALAMRLVRAGVDPETPVGLALPRSIDLVIAQLAVLRAGGAYVPLDPELPAERVAQLAAQAGITIVLRPGLALEENRAARALPRVHEEQLAYVLFTSGSTGVPKAVAVTHRGLRNHMRWIERAMAFDATDVFFQKTPASFDASVWEFYAPLLCGARLVIAKPDGHRDPAYLASVMRDRGVTRFQAVPSLLAALVQEPAFGRHALRTIFSGGEALQPQLAAKLRAHAEVVNLYGPTEVTIDATSSRVSGDVVAIGRPVDGVAVYVVVDGRLAPRGAAGELWLAGEQLARGYLGRADLTAERFVPSPFGESGSRAYRTGDLVRWRNDGELEYLGRDDHQVKLRGFRIELGEIEATLAAQPGVRAAAVIARDDGRGKQLVGYVVPDDAFETIEALRAALAKRLPEYMVPSAFLVLEAMPVTTSGKVDRRALPAADLQVVEYVAPRSDAERIIAAVWGDVLRVERVSATDDFFALGGHSLLATRVLAKLREQLGVELPIRALFEAPTVAQLAQRAADARRVDRAPLTVQSRDAHPPLSYAQERLWFIDQLEPGSATYNMPTALRLEGALDVPMLERVLGEVLARHEALRTTFDTHDGRPFQVVHPATALSIPVVDVRDDVDTHIQAESSTPFDLARGPLLRARLLRVSPREHVLVIVMHHIVSDGWSMGVLVREVVALYAGRALPPLAVQYVDYALWQRTQLADARDEEDYWRRQLAGAPSLLELPTDRPRGAVQSFVGASLPVRVGAEQVSTLRDLAREHDVTLFMVLLAAWQTVLGRYSGSNDVVVGSPIANRTSVEVEPLIGFFVNTLALRTDLAGDPTFVELLARVRETTLAAYEHQQLPFERVVEVVNPPRSLAYTPLFQVLFALQNVLGSALEVPGLALTPLTQSSATAKFDLTLNLLDRDGVLDGVLEYSTALFDRVSMERLVDSFHTLLRDVARDPQRSIGRLRLVADDTPARRLAGSGHERPIRRALAHEYIDAQARATPDAIAVVDAARQLTYRELDERASRLAAHLQALGVVEEQRVGIASERGVDLAVALLGVWKSGATSVTIDLSHPESRIAGMLSEGDVRVVVAHGRTAARLHGPRVVSLEDSEHVTTAYVPRGHAESLHYVVYTSGSTGQPKGVALPHHVFANLVEYQLETLPLGQRTQQFASLGFDVSIQEIVCTLASGGTLYFLDEATRLDLEALGRSMTERRIECAYFPVVMLQQLAEHFADDVHALGSLRDVITSGEQLVVTDAIVRLFERLPGARLHNQYGPSETHLVTMLTLDGPPREWPRHVPIGTRIPNGVVRVLDPALAPVPQGAIGGLYLGGAPLGRGYLGRPELTAERFLPDPLADEPGARMYWTGDLARVRNDGTLEYLGRADRQVKVRGFRVELDEIEAAITNLPGVRTAAVLARGAGNQRRLVAYVAGDPTVDAMKDGLRKTLPDYMLPSAWAKLDALPITSSGKVDRKALPEVELASTIAYAAPTSPNEHALVEIWQQTLGLPRVGIDDNYFELGGDSLRSVQIVARARARGLRIDVQDLFRHQTVRALAAVVRAPDVATSAPTGNLSGLAASQLDALRSRLRNRSKDGT